MTGVLIKRGNLNTHTPHEGECRDQGDISEIQGRAEVASKPPEARGEELEQILLHGTSSSWGEPTLRTPWSWTSSL